MNVSERQQKKKKRGFWERTEAKGSVKGQSAPLQVHSGREEENDLNDWVITHKSSDKLEKGKTEKFVDVWML